MSFTVAVAGASGYAGGEVLRLLAGHPEFVVRTVTAHSNSGEKLGSVHPHLRAFADLALVDTTADALRGHDVVILALPHGASGAIAADLPAETLVIDCGADHRLENQSDWDSFYIGPFSPAWTYGIPELLVGSGTKQRDAIAGATRIAAPGCNASAVTLALAPGIAAALIEPTDLVSVLAVGPSGAGKAARTDLLGAELMGSANPYAVGGVHRHTPEIVQNLRKALPAGADMTEATDLANVTISMTPVLVPMARGILATSTARLKPCVTAADVRAAWLAAYVDEPFVHVLPEGQFPRSGDTVGANTCLIGLTVDEAVGRVVVVSALDNLVKGTAGAAIQSANIALGLPETMGLTVNGVAP